MDSETDRLERRISELEDYINDYHEMLEDRLQWQAERVVNEVSAVLSGFAMLVAALIVGSVAKENFPDRGLLGDFILGLAFLAAWFCVGIIIEKYREGEISRLSKPWNFVRKIDRFE